MRDFFQKLKEQGNEAGLNLLMAIITMSLFAVAIAVAMRLVTDQFRGTNSLVQTRGRAQVTRTVASMDCCLTLKNLNDPVASMKGLSCDQINGLITETYGAPNGSASDKATIIPLKTSSRGPIEIGASQTNLDSANAGRDRGRYMGKWNFSVRCQGLPTGVSDIDQDNADNDANVTKYLNVFTWRRGVDPLTNEDLEEPRVFFQTRSCAGELNGIKPCP